MYSKWMNEFYRILDRELNNLLPEIKALRKELHQFPETAWNEKETRKRLVNILKPCSKEMHEPYVGTDIVFDIPGETKSDALLLRSDMDALCQLESGDKPYKSLNTGAAHNCGHDGHMSMLTGAALLIDRMIKKGYPLPRPVRFVFQPAEEIECGGAILASAGILKDVGEVLAIHGWPSLEKGKIFSKKGPFFAAAATISIVVKGKATHGGLPRNGLSPFPAASLIINYLTEIQDIFEGKAIVSPCIINGGSSANIIPETIEIQGTIRYYDKSDFKEIQQKITESAKETESQSGCKIEIQYISKYKIPVTNDGIFLEQLSELLVRESSEYKEIPSSIVETGAKTVSEDFAFYTDKKPGALVLLGLGENTPSLHASNFDFPEEVLIKGILLFTTAAFKLINMRIEKKTASDLTGTL